MARTTFVHSFGINGKFENIGSVKANIDLEPGLLVGRDATTGKLIKATQLAGSVVRALTMVIEGSMRKPGLAHVANPDEPLYAGQAQDMVETFLVEVPKNTFSMAEVAAATPIYLGLDGAWTKTVPTGTGTLKQQVGKVVEHNFIRFDLSNPQGEILA